VAPKNHNVVNGLSEFIHILAILLGPSLVKIGTRHGHIMLFEHS